MAFGRQVGNIADLKKSLSRGQGTYIKYIPRDEGITVRFLQEPEHWLVFQEVYDQMRRKSYPVPDEGMPGFPGPDERVSTRYLANALDVDNDRVIPLQLPKDLANQLVVRWERYNTIMDRDYELFRTGQGLDTVYGATPESPSKIKLDKYKPLDLEVVLEEAYESVWGAQTPTQTAAKKTVTAGAATKRRKIVEPIELDKEDDDETEVTVEEGVEVLFELAKSADDDDDEDAQAQLTELSDVWGVDVEAFITWNDVAEALKEVVLEAEGSDDEDEDEDPEDDDEADFDGLDLDDEDEDDFEDDEDEDDDEYTKDDLQAKTIGELRAIARERDVAVAGMKKSQIIAALLS